MNIKKKDVVWAMNDGMCTILQVTKCTDVRRQMLFAKGLSEFVLRSAHTKGLIAGTCRGDLLRGAVP